MARIDSLQAECSCSYSHQQPAHAHFSSPSRRGHSTYVSSGFRPAGASARAGFAPVCRLDVRTRGDSVSATPQRPQFPPVPTYVKAPGRIIAIPDIHGDINKCVVSLELAGVLRQVDQRPIWCGGNTVVVQLGDVLDRGDTELGTLMLLRDLNDQAQRQGGAIYVLNGNHETLTVAGNFRFATRGGMQESAKAMGVSGPALHDIVQLGMARRRMYKPGGPGARLLALNPTVLVVNDTLFVHGGLLPQHVDYGLQAINDAVSAWMRGDTPTSSKDDAQMIAMGNAHSVVWNRMFGAKDFQKKGRAYVQRTLRTVLDRVGATDMVIGHTPQMEGANMELDGQLWRMDVGMSMGVLNAAPQVLEITRDASNRSVKRVLTALPVTNGIPCGVPYCQIRW